MSTTNDPVQLPAAAGFYLLDLGVVRLDAPPVGNQVWQGVVQAMANNDGETCSIDQVFLQPLDEYAGVLSAAKAPTPALIQAVKKNVSWADNSGYGTVAWTLSTPSGNSVVLPTSTSASHYLLAQNFNFIIPSGATIAGILVQAEVLNRSPGTVNLYDGQIRLLKGGVVQATERRNAARAWPFSWGVIQWGDINDLWGTALLPADVMASNFGVALSVQNTQNVSVEADIGAVQMAVYYTLPSGLTVSQEAVFYANRNAELRTDGAWRQDPTGSFYGPAPGVRGDLPRVPPSGLENRPCELLIVPSRGDLEAVRSYADSGLDAISVVPRIRPCYLTRP
jgi:hypothetical protein